RLRNEARCCRCPRGVGIVGRNDARIVVTDGRPLVCLVAAGSMLICRRAIVVIPSRCERLHRELNCHAPPAWQEQLLLRGDAWQPMVSSIRLAELVLPLAVPKIVGMGPPFGAQWRSGRD